MKYAHLEKNTNKLLGWYSKDIHITTNKKSMKIEIDLTEDEILNMDEKEIESIVDKHLKYNNIKYDYRELEGVSKDYIQTNLYTIIYTFPISECLEVTDEVWQEALKINANCYENGKFIVKDFRTTDEIEKNRINIIKYTASVIILEKYPMWKQLNLRAENSEATVAMDAWISAIRKISNEAEKNGIGINDIDWTVK